MTVTIWHNPRCTKSRATLKLLEKNGIDPKVVDYLQTPPSEGELRAVLGKLRLGPRDVIRRGEALYKELELADPSLSDAALITAMAANPVLIERPIVVKGEHAALGRPPENVLGIL